MRLSLLRVVPALIYRCVCPFFRRYHGNITALNTIRDITAIVQTGDLHIAIYDLTNQVLHTANARRSTVTTGGTHPYHRCPAPGREGENLGEYGLFSGVYPRHYPVLLHSR